MAAITNNIKTLYNDEDKSELLRETFHLPYLAILLLGPRMLAKEKDFEKLLYEVPGFAADWAKGLMGAMGRKPKPVDTTMRYKCEKCKAVKKHCLIDPLTLAKLDVEIVLCTRCFTAPTWKDWVG